MKIEAVEAVAVRIPTVRPHRMAMATVTKHTSVVVQVRDSDGAIGVGEVGVIGGYGDESVESICHDINEVSEVALVGLDPMTFGLSAAAPSPIHKLSRYASAAIDMAMQDLLCRRNGLSAQRVIGTPLRKEVEFTWVLATGAYSSDLAEAERMASAHGIRNFLIKAGRESVDVDLVRIKRICASLGPGFSIRVDANQSWDELTAREAMMRLADFGVAVIEQPVAATDLRALRRLTESGVLPVMADESAVTVEDVAQISDSKAASAVSVKVCKSGSIVAAQQIANIAHSSGLTVFGGTMIESSVGAAALLRVFSTFPSLHWGCQLIGPLLLADDLAMEPLEVHDGKFRVPDGPGLSGVLDTSKLNFYRRR
ncbi:enolase C-terminal domain-like protein [Rhodococcus sp. 5A-K4]|uniref:enolase C-terminal domain-like protein n=1 Tax=Rhodococcus TaxID=1827 RepID=UPI00355BADD1